jgi:nucleoside 2-deoxyribosyltransferase
LNNALADIHGMKHKIYIAAPLFSEAELTFNLELTDLLRQDFEVFLPQEDGGLIVKMVREGMPREMAVRKVFEIDVAAVRSADIVLIVLDGRSIDEGACFELGLGYALNKLCIGIQTDPRRLLPTGNNPMIDAAVYRSFESKESLVKWLKNNMAEVDSLIESV